MQILTEELTPDQSNIIIQESTQDLKTMWIAGAFGIANTLNGNKRVYPLAEMNKAVANCQKIIEQNGGIFGELEHPSGRISIASDRISHAITELRMEGNTMYGKAKILPTPMGQIAKALFESGVRCGVSTRGTGNLNESGEVSDFNLVTVDIVTQPSAPNAYPSSIYESLDTKQGAKVLTLAEQVCQDHDAQKYLKREIMRWINSELLKK